MLDESEVVVLLIKWYVVNVVNIVIICYIISHIIVLYIRMCDSFETVQFVNSTTECWIVLGPQVNKTYTLIIVIVIVVKIIIVVIIAITVHMYSVIIEWLIILALKLSIIIITTHTISSINL